jgi:signal transduction histidine kinase
VSLGLEAVRRALRDDPDRAGEILDRAQAEVRSAVDEVHRILDGLRPSVLDELGLVGALRAQAHDPAGDLDIEVVAAADLSALEPEVEIAAYHIALEAVTNARRHAGATRCTVRLDRAQGQVHVEIRDDGHGLPSQPRQGIGLASMRHRAESLGGLLTVQSGPAGTRVVADIPRQRS